MSVKIPEAAVRKLLDQRTRSSIPGWDVAIDKESMEVELLPSVQSGWAEKYEFFDCDDAGCSVRTYEKVHEEVPELLAKVLEHFGIAIDGES